MKTNIVLISNGCLDEYPDNTLTRFTNIIPASIRYETENQPLFVKISRVFFDVSSVPVEQPFDLYILLDEIDNTYSRNSSHQIAHIKLPTTTTKIKDKYLVRYFKHATYVQLQDRPLQQLTIQINISDGERSPVINPGRPTVIEMELTDEPDNDDFILSFSSHDPRSLLMHQDNTVAHFRCNLPREMNFAGYDVALEELLLPKWFWDHVDTKKAKTNLLGERACVTIITPHKTLHISYLVKENIEEVEKLAFRSLPRFGIYLSFYGDTMFQYTEECAGDFNADNAVNLLATEDPCGNIMWLTESQVITYAERFSDSTMRKKLGMLRNMKSMIVNKRKKERMDDLLPENDADVPSFIFNPDVREGFHNYSDFKVFIYVNNIFNKLHNMNNFMDTKEWYELEPNNFLEIPPACNIKRDDETLSQKYSLTLLHSDLIKPTIMGNQFANILHFVPLKFPDHYTFMENYMERFFYSPEFHAFKPCITGNITSVDFSFNLLNGRPFPLIWHKFRPEPTGHGVVINLRFRLRRCPMHSQLL